MVYKGGEEGLWTHVLQFHGSEKSWSPFLVFKVDSGMKSGHFHLLKVKNPVIS